MRNKKVYFKSNPLIAVNVLALILALQCVAIVAQYFSFQSSIHQAVDNVQRRISLDSAFLDVGNKTLNTPVNQFAIQRYMNRLNGNLKQNDYPVIVKGIQGIETSTESFVHYPSETFSRFVNAEQEILVVLRSKTPFSALTFSWTSLLASLVISPLFFISNKTKKTQKALEEEIPPSPKLIINLQNKTISNGVDDKVVTLQNKPLCFYTALVKYCIEYSDTPLPPHKDVPPELLALANKSFGRLIELGHTKRKRPDFNANLDKTLSEIRAALDELFLSYNEEKEKYYPPRAQGEGSRSKQHSYALPPIKEEDIEIIGN
ncbi:hypothetical protein [Alteromonas macleodii]|uniref:Uncharacterized protein n=1 Tax=Alteromonas macleodii TaxID=28108 RepID=A0A6T9Y3N1_ALTMA|nr:hypothetical protein [Alteromonas macleodii]CAB9495444.1 conserved protein of unknown function [Alteromonas macleodii]